MFVQRTREALWHLMSRQLADLRLAVVMLDGIEIKGRTNIVALGITTEGNKLALGLWAGSTENATIASALLSDLVSRGLDVEQGLLFVIDGSEALRKAIRQAFGDEVRVQRCVRHKERNVLELLPERDRPPIKRRLTQAWQEADHAKALEQLRRLAVELDHEHPGAAASLRSWSRHDPQKRSSRLGQQNRHPSTPWRPTACGWSAAGRIRPVRAGRRVSSGR